MRLGLIDLPYDLAAGRRLTFSDSATLDDYDLVLWHPAALRELYPNEPLSPDSSRAPRAVGLLQAQKLVMMSRHWRAEFEAFVDRGGALAILDPGPEPMEIHTVQDIARHDLADAFSEPFAGRLGAASGDVACPFGEPFRSFFDAAGGAFVAASRFDPGSAQPVAVDATSGQPCSVYVYRHPGRVVVLPGLRPSIDRQDLEVVVSSLIHMVLRLNAAASTTGLVEAAGPTDVAELPQRAALRSRLAEVVAQRRALQAEEASLKMQLADLAFIDRLDSDEPDTAMAAAALILHALGTYSQSGPSGTGSVMFDAGGDVGVLVAPPQGMADGSARERLAAVARQWQEALGLPVQALLYVADASAPLWNTATVSRFELLEAYDRRDREAPRRWLARARAIPGAP